MGVFGWRVNKGLMSSKDRLARLKGEEEEEERAGGVVAAEPDRRGCCFGPRGSRGMEEVARAGHTLKYRVCYWLA